jgi:hypothetical protein
MVISVEVLPSLCDVRLVQLGGESCFAALRACKAAQAWFNSGDAGLLGLRMKCIVKPISGSLMIK